MLSEIELTNKEICSKCGGACCKSFACACSPEDFNYDINLMKQALESGNYSIDFIRNDSSSFIHNLNGGLYLSLNRIIVSPDESFIIRARNKDRPIVDILHKEYDDEGPCVFWSVEKGCSLSFNERPKFGRTLIPDKNFKCKSLFNPYEIVQEWRPYNAILFHYAIMFFDKNWILYKEIDLHLWVHLAMYSKKLTYLLWYVSFLLFNKIKKKLSYK